jgi:hypothetical protein
MQNSEFLEYDDPMSIDTFTNEDETYTFLM